MFLNQTVRVSDGCWHEHVGFIGGVAKHKPLVTGALLFIFAFIYAHCDIGRLFANGVDHRAGGTVEANLRTVVANIQHHVSTNILYVYRGFSCDLTSEDDHAGFHHRFAGNAGISVFTKDGIKNRVRNLVSHLIWMAL